MKKILSLLITFACVAYTVCSLEKTSLYPVTLTCLPTDMLRLITHQIGETSNVAEARKHFAALATSCKTLNIFLKKEKQECLKQLFLAVQRDNDAHVKNLTNHLIRMMRTEDIFFSADKDGNTLMHHVALKSPVCIKYNETANYHILMYLVSRYHEYRVSKNEELMSAIKNKDIKSLKQLLRKIHPDSGIRLNMIPNKNGQRPSCVTCKFASAKRYLTRFYPFKFFSKNRLREPEYDRYVIYYWGGFAFRFGCESYEESSNLDLKTFTPLMFACVENNKEAVKELLLAGANPNIQSDHDRESSVPFSTALMMTKNVEIQKLLFEYGAQPNLTNIFNETVLIQALKERRIDSIELLLNNGVDGNIPSLPHSGINSWHYQMSALEYFWKKINGNPTEQEWRILKLLAQKTTHKTPFEHAILEQDCNKIKRVVSNTNLAIQMIKKYKKCIKEHLDEIDILLNKDLLAPNRCFKKGPLLNYLFKNAKFFEKDKLVKHVEHLIDLGADLFLKPKKSSKPIVKLMKVKGTKGLALLKLVLKKKKNIGLIPSYWTFDFEKTELLLEHGADPNTQDSYGYIALSELLKNEYTSGPTLEEKKKWIELFHRYGADFNLKNRWGESVVDMIQKRAEKTNHYGLLDFLVEIQSNKNKTLKN